MADLTPAQIDARLKHLHGQLEAAAELSDLHEQAAQLTNVSGDHRFHITHAWVFALVAGDDARIALLEARLRALGGL